MASVSTTAPTAASPPAARIPIKSRPLRPKPEPEPRIQILKDDTIASIADVITGGIAKNIIVMTGAGISTAAGIKDFRSPGTGLYDDLEKYNLPFPEAVFDLAFFKETPRPFYHLAKHLYPGQYRPTLTHYLLPLLAKKKLLLRSYTQNIDSLERLAGLDEDLLVEAHGSFASSKCVQCEMTSDSAWVKRHIMDGEIPYCKRCSGLVKPSITFFGENVPLRFTTMAETDFEKCDLLIVLGTSLKVEPFNKLIAKVSPKCPRLLINREKAGQELHSGFDFEDKWRYTVQRDAVFLGNCDDGVRKLAELCGWEDELQSMYDTGHEQLRLMQEQDELKSEDTQKSDDDEEDDCEKDDVDNDDGSENKSCPDTLDSSSSSLDDITYRFGRSTLQSQSDDSSISSEVGTSSSSEKDGDVHLKLKSTVADTLVPRTETDSPILQGAKSSTSESTQKDTSSKDALKSVSQVQDPNKDGAPDRMFSSKQALSQKRASTIPATQSVTNQRSHPSQAKAGFHGGGSQLQASKDVKRITTWVSVYETHHIVSSFLSSQIIRDYTLSVSSIICCKKKALSHTTSLRYFTFGNVAYSSKTALASIRNGSFDGQCIKHSLDDFVGILEPIHIYPFDDRSSYTKEPAAISDMCPCHRSMRESSSR
ncbi:NAD-dependent protein deacetylase sirtuin-2 [Mortierella claussenii]|nr:NAD-dependent protein deacetylase sirtuin-2 [Mortierella claussenii]